MYETSYWKPYFIPLLMVVYIVRFWFNKKGSFLMMAMLFACRIVEGRTQFSQVPAKLKQPVADVLINEFGMPELVPIEFGGTLA